MNKNIKIFYAGVLLVSPFLVQGVSATENDLPLEESSKNVVTEKDDDAPLIKPKKGLDWSIRPQLITGASYFSHFTLDQINLSNKPVPFIGIGLSTNLNNWFLNGYILDSAKTTDHVFQTGSAPTLTENNYNFQRQDYSITIGREVTDWFTDSKKWGVSLFAGYRQGVTKLKGVAVDFNRSPTAVPSINFDPVKFDPKKPETFPTATVSANANDVITNTNSTYTTKGPMFGTAFRIRPFANNTELGLTLGYGPLDGKYERTAFATNSRGLSGATTDSESARLSALVTTLSWNAELTPNLSYSLTLDYYSFNMPFLFKNANGTSTPLNIREQVSNLKLFLNYRF